MEERVSESLVRKAEQIAAAAHEGQYDEAGVPYIEHPRFVAGLLGNNELKVIALLHDVMEDTDVTEQELRPIFGDRITDALLLMTRDKSEDYSIYIERLSHNELSRKVKLADLTHNMDMNRMKVITDKELERNHKYHKAYDFLMEIERKNKAS
ncbi:MAG: HD domain-containing protein [Clostridiales bacterium]|nr:HD domain-containing protein [Candidatus Blautia equi]